MPSNMIKMITKKPHTYGTRALVAGNEFEARGESDARLLAALGRAERALAKVEPPPAPPPRVAAKTGRGRWGSRATDPVDPPPWTPTVPDGLVGESFGDKKPD